MSAQPEEAAKQVLAGEPKAEARAWLGWLALVMFALFAAVLGGLESLQRSVIAGFVVGMGQVFWSAYFSPSYAAVAVFAAVLFMVRFLPRAAAHRTVSREM
jgi:branched-subunit amino acid ABC-type transport system permease component